MKIDEEELYEYYILENHSRKDTAKYFNVTENELRVVLSKYNIKKDRSLFASNISKSLKEKDFDIIVEKRKATCLERYGVDNPAKADIVKDKYHRTISIRDRDIDMDEILDKYLNENKTVGELSEKYNISKNHLYYLIHKSGIKKDKSLVLKSAHRVIVSKYRGGAIGYQYTIPDLYDRNTLIEYIETTFKRKPHITELAESLQVPYGTMAGYVHKYHVEDHIEYNKSRFENMVEDILIENNLVKGVDYLTHDRKLIKPLELDFYLPKLELAIEVNDFATHLDKPEGYHENKSKLCEESGVILMHVWEDVLLNKDKYKQLKEDLTEYIYLLSGENL